MAGWRPSGTDRTRGQRAMSFDVIVVGGSYAGMAAALQVARARRTVLVIDAGRPRNRFARTAHGVLGRDGQPPEKIAAEAKAQLLAYPDLTWRDGLARHAVVMKAGFRITMEDGATVMGLRLVLALGVEDVLPDIPGLKERWGKSVFHCPYCEGYELGGGAVGAIAARPISMVQALLLPDWGPTTFFTNGVLAPDAAELARLGARGVTVETTPVAEICGAADVRLADGRTLSFAGLFTAPGTRPASPLAGQLGCVHLEGPFGRYIHTDGTKQTSVPGVFACGDLGQPSGSISIAVGDGAAAGRAAHHSLVLG